MQITRLSRKERIYGTFSADALSLVIREIFSDTSEHEEHPRRSEVDPRVGISEEKEFRDNRRSRRKIINRINRGSRDRIANIIEIT